MAATVGHIFMNSLKGGVPLSLSIHNTASLAAGNYVPVDFNSPAVATSPTEFSVPFPCKITDFIPTAATGTIEITSGGRRTNVVLDYAAFGATNPGRPKSALPALLPGRTYRLLVVVALAA